MRKALATLRGVVKKEDEEGSESGSPFHGRKKKGEEEDGDSAHPFGPPRRTSESGKELRDSKDGSKDGDSPFQRRKGRNSMNESGTQDVLPQASEADDSESAVSQSESVASEAPAVKAEELPVVDITLSITISGHVHDFAYPSNMEVRTVMANLQTKVSLGKNMELHHPLANVFLEPTLEIGCYWDKEGSPLFLNMVSTSKLPASKEAKVKFKQGKKTVHAYSIQVFKHTTALGIIMNGGLEKDYRPSRYALTIDDKAVDPSTVMWKRLGGDLTIVALEDLPPVNLRVHFVEEDLYKVLKVGSGSTAKSMLDACKKKWIVRTQDGSDKADYGFYLKDEGNWLNEDARAYTFAERKDVEFRKLNSLPDPAAAPLTEKEKKAHRDRIEKEVNLFLQRRPPNSATSSLPTGKEGSSKNKGKYIDCCLNYDVIDFCLGFLEKRKVLDLEGIYRISGNSDLVRHVWAALCLGHMDYLNWQSGAGDIAHVVTGACKLYLRELERPLLPFDTHKDFLGCQSMEDKSPEKLERMKELVDKLDDTSQHTLRRLMFHLWEVSTFEKENKMPPENLAIVFGPTIMRPEVQDLQEMLNNQTKVDLCTYMTLQREALFDLERLKPLEKRMLGTKPDLGLPEPSASRASKVTMRKGKSRAQLDDSKPVAGSPSSSDKSMDKKSENDKGEKEKEKESKRSGFHSITSRVKSATSSQNPRGQTDCLQAMSSDLVPEMIAGSLVFTRQMEVDGKTFRKQLKNVPQDMLIDVIHNLAKQVASSPSTGTTRNVKTIAVGAPKAGLTSVSSAATSSASSSPKMSQKKAEEVADDSDDVPKPQRAPPSITVEQAEEESATSVADEEAVEGGAAAVIAAEEPMTEVTESPEASPVKPDEEDGDVVIVNASEDNHVEEEEEEPEEKARGRAASILDLTVEVDSPGPVRFEPEPEDEDSEKKAEEEEVTEGKQEEQVEEAPVVEPEEEPEKEEEKEKVEETEPEAEAVVIEAEVEAPKEQEEEKPAAESAEEEKKEDAEGEKAVAEPSAKEEAPAPEHVEAEEKEEKEVEEAAAPAEEEKRAEEEPAVEVEQEEPVAVEEAEEKPAEEPAKEAEEEAPEAEKAAPEAEEKEEEEGEVVIAAEEDEEMEVAKEAEHAPKEEEEEVILDVVEEVDGEAGRSAIDDEAETLAVAAEEESSELEPSSDVEGGDDEQPSLLHSARRILVDNNEGGGGDDGDQAGGDDNTSDSDSAFVD